MYNYIIGVVTDHYQNAVIIENNQIGYMIYTANPFVFSKDEEAKVYIYQHITENDHILYGFKSEEEKELFLKLINVKGLGPKMALPILATGSISGIVDAIERENILYLKKFPKIGDKLAKQIILDLKGKLASFDVSSTSLEVPSDDLYNALRGLGYKEKEIKQVILNVDLSMGIEEQIKEALKLLLK